MSLVHVVWDWNGTLLDDMQLCVDSLNTLCKRRGIRPLEGLDEYRATFTFPVIEYYRSVGFDFDREPFEIPAREWVELYTAGLDTRAGLFGPVRAVLESTRAMGLGQSILSAHEEGMLRAALSRYGLDEYFDSVAGLDNHYAVSKVELGRRWIEQKRFDPRRVLMAGDTLHDHEVASALGMPCVLLAQGHQSKERLLTAGVPVLDSVGDVPAFLATNVTADCDRAGLAPIEP